jgi:hypothetical protein
MDGPLRFVFRSPADDVLGRVGTLGVTLLVFGVALTTLAMMAPRPQSYPAPVVLDCAVQVRACEARLPDWYRMAVDPRLGTHVGELTRAPSREEVDLLDSDRPEDRARLRADLFVEIEHQQRLRLADWVARERERGIVGAGRILGVVSVVGGLLGLVAARVRRARARRVAVVHRHRVELGDEVLHFADLAEGDASIVTARFVGDRDGDAAGLRRAILARIPAGRASREVDARDRAALEGLRG